MSGLNPRSRRFVVNGSEYKWKIRDESDLFVSTMLLFSQYTQLSLIYTRPFRQCVDSGGRTIATWSKERLKLTVSASAEEILDQLVVTCLVHVWFIAHGYW